MSVAALLMIRNEEDVIEDVLLHLRTQVDWVVVYDNMSDDGTADILWQLENGSDEAWLKVHRDEERGYFQSQKMTRWANELREQGFQWVVPCDADEVWYANGERIADLLERVGSHVNIVRADLYDHVATGGDDLSVSPMRGMGWHRRLPGVLPKVAARLLPGLVIEQGNHGARYPVMNDKSPIYLNIRHFPYRSAKQFVSKAVAGAAAYDATDLPPTAGQHWRDYARLYEAGGQDALEEVFRTWFWCGFPEMDPLLIFDPAPLGQDAPLVEVE